MRRTFTAEEKASVFELWKNGSHYTSRQFRQLLWRYRITQSMS